MGLRIGGITFGGIASGLPTDQIIEQLLELERRPIQLLEDQKAEFETRLEILQDLNTRTRALRDALRDMDNMNLLGTGPSISEEFKRFTASTSDETVVTATAANGAQAGSLSVRVDALAAAQRDVGDQSYTTLQDAIGTGTFQITIDGTSTDVVIDGTNATVEGFIGAVNDSGADVTAFALNDGSAAPYRIVIVGNQSGASQAITYGSGGTGVTLTSSQLASDASVVLDPNGPNPITVTNTTNTFANVIQGLTFEARSVSATAVTVDVDEDAEAVAEAIGNLVASYNAVIEVINEQAQIDPATNRGGPLLGDSTLLSLQRRLSSVIASSIGTGPVQIAAQIGLELDREGKLSLDEDELAAAVAGDLENVGAFFAGVGSFADQLRAVAADFVDPVDGFLVARIDGTSETISDIDDQIADAEDRLSTVEENLVRQFSALESRISEIQQQSNFLNQFIVSSLG